MPVSTGLNDRSIATPSVTPIVAPVVQIAQQIKSLWCWAAVISSITQSKPVPPSPYTSQCLLACQTYGGAFAQADCCQSGTASNICNNSLSVAVIAGSYSPGAPSPLSIAGIAADPPSRADSTVIDDTIVDALRQNRPTCIVITWPGGQLHFVAIVGSATMNGQLTYAIGDPYDASLNWLDRASIADYHSHAGSGGTWGDTYVTI